MGMKKKAITISSADDAPLSTALVLADKPAGAGNELATLVASFTTEYNNLDWEINDLTTELLEENRKLVKRFDEEVIPLVNRRRKTQMRLERKLKSEGIDDHNWMFNGGSF